MDRLRRIESDGLILAVEIFGCGSPLIFAHGLTDSRLRTCQHLAPLADNWTVIAFDQRGHADSTPVTNTTLYDGQHMAGDIAAILDTLEIDRAIVGGESTGAATALLFALRWPQRVEALLLSGPAFGDRPNPGRDQIKEIGRRLTCLGIEGFVAQAVVQDWVEAGFSPEAMASWASVLRSHNPASIATACEAIADWVILPEITAVADLDMPACIVAWENDPVHPHELASRLAHALPNAQLVSVPSLSALVNDTDMLGRMYQRFLSAARAQA